MKLAVTSFILLCFAAGVGAQNIAHQSLVLKTDGKLTWATFSPDGKLLATSYGEKTTVRLWDTQTGELRARLSGKDDPTKYEDSSVFFGRITMAPASSTFSPDGRLLAVTAYMANEVRLWDVQSGKLLVTLRGLSEVRDVRFSRDGRILAIAAGDQGLLLLDVTSGSLLTIRWQLHDIKSVDGIWFPPDEKTIALTTISFDNPKYSVYLINFETGSVKARAGDRRGKNYIAYLSEDGREMGTVSESGEVSMWDVVTGQMRWTLKLPRKGYKPMDFGPGAQNLAVLNEDGSVGIWDCGTGQIRMTLPEKEKVEFIGYSGIGRGFLLTVTKQGIRLWDARTLELRGEMAGARLPVAFSPDGRVAVSAGDGNKATLWNISSN